MDKLLTIFISLCIGGAVFCIALAVFRYLSSLENDKVLLSDDARSGLSINIKLALKFAGFFRPLTNYEIFAARRKILEQKLAMAGLSDTLNSRDFIAVQMVYGGFAFLVFLLCAQIEHALIGLIMGLILGIYPNLWLNSVIKSRQLQIMKALPNLLDLLTLSVEAGKDFLSALRDILVRRKVDALGSEWMRTFQEIQLGSKRSDALRALAKRVNQNDLTSVVNAIIQAEELGVSIAELLRIQGDMLRNKRFTLAEKLANEAPVKIILPIIIFIFPAVMIILLGPIIMQALNVFGG